jgi:hypothetical protein
VATYPGLDIDAWDDRLIWLWQRSNLRFCGFYLAHDRRAQRSTWTPHWRDLRDDGWGAFVLWVPFSDTGIDQMRTADGGADGRHTAALAEAAGVEKGAVLYLDIEAAVLGKNANPGFARYVTGWMSAVAAARYRPGAYCSHLDVTKDGLLSAAFDRLRPALFPFSIAGANRARFDRDTFTLPPAPPRSWAVGRTDSWPDSPAVVGSQYDWYNADRTEKSFDWPDATGRRDRRSARSVDWDAAKVFDPSHPWAAGAVAAAPDAAAPDWVSLYVVRPTLIETSDRGRQGRLAMPVELRLTAADIGPEPSPELAGFDANGAAAVSRRTGHHDLFLLGLDGFVRTAWVNPRETRPTHPWPLNPDGPARKGSPLAATSRAPDQLDVFYVDRSHQLVTQWWHPARTDWARQRRVIGGPPVAGGSTLAALPAPTDAIATPDRLDVFFVTFDHSLPGTAGPGWNDRWQLAHAFWTASADWRTETVTVPGGVAAASGVAAARTADRTIHVLAQRRDRTGLIHATLPDGGGWRLGPGPGLSQPGAWTTLQLAVSGTTLVLAGMTSEARLGAATWANGRWTPGVTAPAAFSTGRPLSLVRRGPAIDVIGLEEDGALAMRSLELPAGGGVAVRP